MFRLLTTTGRPRASFSEIELIFNDSTKAVAAWDRPSGMKRSSSVNPFPFFPIGIALLIRPYRVGWLYPSLARANRFNRSLLFRKLNCFTDFHHAQIGFYVALFQFAIKHF